MPGRVLDPQRAPRRCPAPRRRPAPAPRAARAARSGRRRTPSRPGTGRSSGRPAWPGRRGGSRPARRGRRRPGTTLKVWSKWPCVSSTASGVSRCSASTRLQRLHGVLAGVDDHAPLARPGGHHVAVGLEGTGRKSCDEHRDQGRRRCGRARARWLSCRRSAAHGRSGAAGRRRSAVATNQMRREAAKRKLERQQERRVQRAKRRQQIARDHLGRGRGRRGGAAFVLLTSLGRQRGRSNAAPPSDARRPRPPTAAPAGRARHLLRSPRPRTSRRPSPRPVPTVTDAPTSGTVRGDAADQRRPDPADAGPGARRRAPWRAS